MAAPMAFLALVRVPSHGVIFDRANQAVLWLLKFILPDLVIWRWFQMVRNHLSRGDQ